MSESEPCFIKDIKDSLDSMSSIIVATRLYKKLGVHLYSQDSYA